MWIFISRRKPLQDEAANNTAGSPPGDDMSVQECGKNKSLQFSRFHYGQRLKRIRNVRK